MVVRPSLLLPLGAAGLVAVALGLWSGGGTSRTARLPGVDPTGIEAAIRPAAEPSEPRLDERREPPGGAALEASPRVSPDRTPLVVRGTLTLAGSAGPPADGTLELVAWDPSDTGPGGHRPHRATIPVRAGRFEARVPPHAERNVARATLAGRPLADLTVMERPSGSSETIELAVTGRALHRAEIEVVDARDGRPLEDVQVVRLEPGDARRHPGELGVTGAGAPSPRVLEPHRADEAALVGAEGHAWQRIEWSALRAEHRFVALEPAGSLALHLDAEDPESWSVALSGPEALVVMSARTEDTVIDGLAPGIHRVALVPRTALVRSQVSEVDAATVRVQAGTVTPVELRAPSPDPAPLAVELSGRLHFSSSWSPGGPHLALRALGETALRHLDTGGKPGGLVVSGAGDDWTFRAPTVVPGGRYLLVEPRASFRHELVIGPTGTHDLALVVPDPLDVEIEVIDEVSGRPVDACELAWLPPGEDALPTGRAPWIEPGELPGSFRARVPGWDVLTFEARAPGHQGATAELATNASRRLRIALSQSLTPTPPQMPTDPAPGPLRYR